eukprot:CAMPEP_0185843576 /NCGR_PEP_ID=MMETSP1354-20130828/1_1 /TAXON_ID=708628 /ORGANISM="Erythrolobus madagascarensis, Strain CCMP3276" /LENGTH=102 /DNA_ID=CAMNT_0028543089 /DNA_START=432 /DNA_END=737 /DNA_ORIENTATION=-
MVDAHRTTRCVDCSPSLEMVLAPALVSPSPLPSVLQLEELSVALWAALWAALLEWDSHLLCQYLHPSHPHKALVWLSAPALVWLLVELSAAPLAPVLEWPSE